MSSYNRPYRGSNRGRGRGGYRSDYPRPTPQADLPPDRDITEGLIVSQIVETLEIPTEVGAKSKPTEIQNLEYVGSYNWSDAAHPTIIVPGSPPEWKGDPRVPFKLTPDAQVQIIDQNGYRVPSAPFLPLMQAADAMGTDVDWPAVDFVTDRNGLRKLMRWIGGGEPKDFRIDLELAGEQTVLLNRWERRYREASSGYTFGLNFEEATTTLPQGCEKSTGHHRIVQYDFFDLKLVVRFEVDACLPPARARAAEAKSSGNKQQPTLDDLADALSGLNVASPSGETSGQPGLSPTARGSESVTPSVRIVRAGVVVPQDAIIELTTRSHNYVDQLDWGNLYPQLYLSKTAHLYLGVHNRGTFSEIRKKDIGAPDLVPQRRGAEAGLRKLGRVLEMIQEIVIQHRDKRLSLVCASGRLQVYERAGKGRCLPADVMGRFVSS